MCTYFAKKSYCSAIILLTSSSLRSSVIYNLVKIPRCGSQSFAVISENLGFFPQLCDMTAAVKASIPAGTVVGKVKENSKVEEIMYKRLCK